MTPEEPDPQQDKRRKPTPLPSKVPEDTSVIRIIEKGKKRKT